MGYGAWEAGGTAWGPNESDDAVIGAMRAALDAGITWIDTAEVYGDGVSESLVGRAIAGRRDEVIVASKVAPSPEGSGFRPEQIGAACDATLCRLGLDAIDLYQLHWPDDGVPGRGIVGRDGRAAGRREGPVDRRLELRPRADRALRGGPSRRLAAARVLDARAATRPT